MSLVHWLGLLSLAAQTHRRPKRIEGCAGEGRSVLAPFEAKPDTCKQGKFLATRRLALAHLTLKCIHYSPIPVACWIPVQ